MLYRKLFTHTKNLVYMAKNTPVLVCFLFFSATAMEMSTETESSDPASNHLTEDKILADPAVPKSPSLKQSSEIFEEDLKNQPISSPNQSGSWWPLTGSFTYFFNKLRNRVGTHNPNLMKQQSMEDSKTLSRLVESTKSESFSDKQTTSDQVLKNLASTDFSQLSLQAQAASLFLLHTNAINVATLILRNCRALNDEEFSHIKIDKLRILCLEGCDNITYRTAKYLSNHALHLEELNLSFNKKIDAIASDTFFGYSQIPLPFLALKKLNLRGCTNLKIVAIKVPNLEFLNVMDCDLLSLQMLNTLCRNCKNLSEVLTLSSLIENRNYTRIRAAKNLPSLIENERKI